LLSTFQGGVKNEVPSTPAAACVAPQRERKEERKADVKALQEGLMSLESATKAALGRVVGCIARRQREDAALGQQLQSAVEAGQLEAAVVERSTRLATEAAALRAELAEAQVKQRDMKEDLSSYKEREMKFEHGVFEAEGETEKLRWELIKAHNEVEGLQSQIQRGTPGIVSSSSSSSSSVGVVPKAAPAAEDGEVDIKLAELEEEADQWKEISATRLTEQEGLRQQIHDLRAAMIKLETSQVPSRDAQQVFAQKEQLQAEIWSLLSSDTLPNCSDFRFFPFLISFFTHPLLSAPLTSGT
jgi:chromosome segregation ATPase